MKKILIMILILSISQLYFVVKGSSQVFKHGTAIVEYWTKDSIWIAADSKETIDGQPDKEVNKIEKWGNIYYTLAGRVGFGNNKKQFGFYDANVELQNILNQTNDFQNISKLYSNTIIPKLKYAISYKLNTGEYKFNDLVNNPSLELVLSEFKNGVPYVYFIMYSVEGISSNWDIKSDSFNIISTNFIATGYCNEINNKVDSDKSYFTKKGYIPNKLKNLIRIAIKNNKITVGAPIYSIVIYKNGYKRLPKSN